MCKAQRDILKAVIAARGVVFTLRDEYFHKFVFHLGEIKVLELLLFLYIFRRACVDIFED